MATKTKTTNVKAFEEAREAVMKIQTLTKRLSPTELETLELLLDKKAVTTINQSLKQAEKGNLRSIEELT